MSHDSLFDRRNFLQKSALAGAGMTALADQILTLRSLNAAVENNPIDDYKALVCIFLFGGNDSNNLIIPRGTTEHAAYSTTRGNLAIPSSDLLPISPSTNDGREWGLHPSVPELQTLFNDGKMAVLPNVGTLVAPITKADYFSGGAALPPQLFSHSDQQVQWQTSVPDQKSRTGWGGRTADLLKDSNSGSVSMSVSLSGANTFQVGDDVLQYRLGPSGSVGLRDYRDPDTNSGHFLYRRSRAVDNLVQLAHGNVFEDSYAAVKLRAIENDRTITNALAGLTENFSFNTSNSLAHQLEMIAKLIALREPLGMCRQIFFASVGGYDTHGDQVGPHASLLANLSEALGQFQGAMEHLNISDSVTAFTASDFGRTYPTNGQGSDHGWGSHHMIMGGAVNGGDFYGSMPVLEVNGPDDTGHGRWIPSTSIDEYSATLAKWFGVSQSDIGSVFPNLGRFARPDIGFLS